MPMPLHFGRIVGEHFKGDRLVLDGLENVLRERLEIRDAGLLHQRRIRGQPLDERIGVEAEHAGLVGAVSIDVNVEVFEGFGHRLVNFASTYQTPERPLASRMTWAASNKSFTLKSGFCRNASA